MNNKKNKISTLTLMGLLFAMALVLAFFESMLPVLPGLPAGVKLGLSNIVTMYTLFCIGFKASVSIAVLKSFFVFLTRGAISASISFCGGMVSVIVMALLLLIFKKKLSYFVISIFGGIFHNIGQLTAVCFYMGTALAAYYLPVLIVSGFFMGMITGTILNVVMPHIRKADNAIRKNDSSL